MTHYGDLLFFIPAGLAILFMIWVFFKFTQQIAGPAKSVRGADAESRYLRAITADSRRGRRASAPE